MKVKIGDLTLGGQIRTRAIVVQRKTKRPVQFELLEPARSSLLVQPARSSWPWPALSSASPHAAAAPASAEPPLRPSRRRSVSCRAGRVLSCQEAIDARFHEPGLPAADCRLRHGRCRHDRIRADAVSAEQDDPRSPDMLLRRVTVGDDRLQPLEISVSNGNRYSSSRIRRFRTRQTVNAAEWCSVMFLQERPSGPGPRRVHFPEYK